MIFISTLAQAERYAVVINGSEEPGFGSLRKQIAEQSARVVQQYEKAGYKVIEIQAPNNEGVDAFKEKLSKIKNVESIDISVIGHGAIKNADPTTPMDAARFPKNHLRPDEVENGDNFEPLTSSIHYAYVMTLDDKDPSDKSQWIGMGDLHSVISNLKLTNPKMVTTIRTLNCFGGNAIRALDNIPDVQVYSSSPAYHTSVTLNKGTITSKSSSDYFQLLTDNLNKDQTFGEAHFQSKKEFLASHMWAFDAEAKSIEDFEGSFAIPLSSMESYFKDQCWGKPEAMDLKNCFDDNGPSVVSEWGLNVARTLTMTEIRKSFELEEKYLDALYSHSLCDGEKVSIPLTLIKEGIAELLKISQTPPAERKKRLEDQLETIKTAKTIEDLKEIDYFNDLDILIIMEGNFDPFQFELTKSLMTLQREGEIEKLSSPKESTKSLEKFSVDKECLESQCDVESLVNTLGGSLILYPSKNPKLLNSFSTESGMLLNKHCPGSSAFASGKNPRESLQVQIKCITDHSKKYPLEALGMMDVLVKARRGDNTKICERIKKEKEKIATLQKCAQNSSEISDTNFWIKMMSLNQLQQRKIGK